MYEYVLQISLCPSRINLPRIPGGTIAYQYHVLIVQWSLLNYNHCNLSHIPTFISFKSSLKESTSGHFEEMWAICAGSWLWVNKSTSINYEINVSWAPHPDSIYLELRQED